MNNFKIVLGEFAGTFILVFIGCGSVGLAILEVIKLSLLQIALLWGAGLSIAIYATRNLSGAHLNPAISISLNIWRKFGDAKILITYVISQLTGAFAAAALLFVFFESRLSTFEKAFGIIRGSNGSERSAMMFGEYFPNPASDAVFSVSLLKAFAMEFIGTSILAFVIFYLFSSKRLQAFAPLLIGLTITTLIYFIAPFTQAGLNPARDFGPRLVSYLGGWGRVALPGPNFGSIVYILGPLMGALFGGGLYQFISQIKSK